MSEPIGGTYLDSIVTRFIGGQALLLYNWMDAPRPHCKIIFQQYPRQKRRTMPQWEYTNAHDALQSYNAKVKRLSRGESIL